MIRQQPAHPRLGWAPGGCRERVLGLRPVFLDGSW